MFQRTFIAAAIASVGIGVSPGFAQDDASSQLAKLIEDERAFYYQENPGTGPRGEPRPVATKMVSVAPADQKRRAAKAAEFLATLASIDGTGLEADELINLQMMRYKLERDQLFLKHRTWRMPLYSDSGFHSFPARMWRGITFRKKADYEAYIERLSDLPRYLKEHENNLRTGMAEGFTMPRVVLDGLLPSFKAMVSDDPTESTFYVPFKGVASNITVADAQELRSRAAAVILEQVIPAYRALSEFMHTEYYPAARDEIGASSLPNGPEYYEAMVRFYTTLNVSADEVHQLGLSEVARIRAEMDQVIKDANFDGSFAEFLAFLRSDPQFYAKTEEELIMLASFIAKKIDGAIPKLFGKLSRQPYGVEAVPASLAPNYTTGRYVSAPLDAPRGGFYWVNTYALDKRPMYAIPALTLHEAVPGHHLQISLAAELENVPDFRLDLYPHAFGEGWGLYAEKLGLELDVYKTPYDHFGRLSYEMWRACRLVIDTGIHAKGWTREQAIKLLEENSALSTHNIRTEVDRYIAWPGQALAYKMGELKILELRKRATERLGDKFDVRTFHDRVLSAGGIPLYLLEQRIDSWIEEVLATG